MIIVTVGTQLPFDRLIKIVDDLSDEVEGRILAQIGCSEYIPSKIEWTRSFKADEFKRILKDARLIISHAGIGSVLTAQKIEKPILLFPRRAEFGEHRNDHQLATCNALEGRPGIYIARSETDLRSQILSGDQTFGIDNTLSSRRDIFVRELEKRIEQLF